MKFEQTIALKPSGGGSCAEEMFLSVHTPTLLELGRLRLEIGHRTNVWILSRYSRGCRSIRLTFMSQVSLYHLSNWVRNISAAHHLEELSP
mgnify:CR=1 FL=1